jgi:Ca-activated chloride channel family protein
MISDGIATVGPSSPEVLGQLASRGADQGVQVTAIGVGLEYDEKTLNALAIKSSGRLYHLAEPKEMSAILDREMKLLQGTMATGAFVEVVPAPGVQLLGADGVRADWNGTGLRVPLGAMFGGQHREILVRVRVTETGTGVRPLASVRLHFRDPAEGNLERVQEVVARFESTSDPLVVERRANVKTRQIMAMNEAAQASSRAAEQVNAGQFEFADQELARAEKKLQESAKQATNTKEKVRIEAQAASVSAARKSASAAAAAPPAARPAKQRASSLEINDRAMDAAGY